jgi:succinyl-CoA synthetase alpha subunit
VDTVGVTGLIRRNSYHDSIALMRVSEEARVLPGVVSAAVVMATDLNREALADAGLLTEEAKTAGPNDLVVAVRVASPEAAGPALARIEALLGSTPIEGGVAAGVPPRSLTSAARRTPGANLAVVSVPGPYAAAEAQQALSAGLHVFLFSDGVPVEAEVALKRRAVSRGLLVMGPECGTSIVNGVGLGFANRVRRGDIGLVGASGTGLQEVTTLIHRLGGGVSQAVGTGGRDLHDAVGGLTTVQALARLEQDAETRAIVIVSKPPSDSAARRVLAAAARIAKPVVACLLGWREAMGAVRVVDTLEGAALAALEAVGQRPAPPPVHPTDTRPQAPGQVRGLFTGGSLGEEAQAIVGGAKHRFTDFGTETYTRGRPHPMIDPRLRNAAVAAAGEDPTVGVVLVDVVLGDGAHADPAGALLPAVDAAIATARRAGRQLAVVAHVVGTDDDPQRLSLQEARLADAGVLVCLTNRLAAELARAIAAGG